ncbi:MAG: hypothetical protein PVI86_00135 [Phycisphaerae bacterium]|jgi:hypothetical protein
MMIRQPVAYAISGLLLPLAAFVVYVGQTGVKAERDRARIAKVPVRWTSVEPYAYEGPATFYERPDGMIVFSRGPTVLPLTIGFDLHLQWDEETAAAAMDGSLELRDVSAWMSIEYDDKTSSLFLSFVDDAGVQQELAYKVGPHSDTAEAQTAFDAHLRMLFDYMNGGDLIGENDATYKTCSSGSCSCAGPGCSCSACCLGEGLIPECDCNPERCRCTCIRAQSC